jgi:hypothetical protein
MRLFCYIPNVDVVPSIGGLHEINFAFHRCCSNNSAMNDRRPEGRPAADQGVLLLNIEPIGLVYGGLFLID